MSKCCGLLRGVVPPHSADISMNAPAVDIVPSRSTAAVIATAPSVRSLPGIVGSPRVSKNFFRHATCTWSSHSPAGWRHWSCRTSSSSTISCSVPVRKLFWKLPETLYAWALKLDSSVCCTPGIKNSNFTRMSIVSFPPEASRSITPIGFAHKKLLSSQTGAAGSLPRQIPRGPQAGLP